MKKKLPFSRIFWPTKCTNSKEGYIIGWNIRSFIGCVACVIPSYETEFEELEMALKLMKEDPYLQDIHQYCSGPPIILGVWQPNESIVLRSKILKEGNIFLEEDNFESQVDILSQKNHTENLWITMTLKSKEESIIVTPSLKSQSLPSHQFNNSTQSNVAVTTVQPIFVDSASSVANNIAKKQFNDKDLQKTTKTRHPTHKNKLDEKVVLSKENTTDNSKLRQRFSKKVSRKSKKSLKNNREKLPFLKELFCFGYQYPTQTQIIFYSLSSPYHYYSTHPICLDFNSQLDDEIGLTELERIMRQGNCSLLIESRLQELLKDKELLNYHYTKENSIERPHQLEISSTVTHRNLNEEKKKEMCTKEENSTNNLQNLTQHNYQHTNYKLKSKENSFYQDNNQRFQNIMIYVLMIINFFISMERTLKIYLCKIFQTFFFSKLYENSSTFKQIETKFAIALRISNSWHGLHKKWKNHPLTLSRSVHFYDSFYLIICDSLLGIIIGILLFSYSGEFLLFISLLKEKFTQVFIISQIEWLMGWPAGFKLNDNLDSFMGQLFLFYNEIWIKFLDFFPFSGNTFVLFVSISGLLGLSTMISILSDFIHISTLHVTWFYTASARIYMYQLHAISSLWKLFRGKKFNVLRNRIDSCDYDIDQLLLGTILFTVIFFLFPTVAIYYLYFSLVRFVIAFIQFVIFCALQILNHFPIYGLVLYLYDWSLFTGGIYFEILYSRDQDNFQCTFLNLKKSPGSIASIFHYYSKLSGNFFKNNSILGIIFCVLSGSPIKLN